MSGQAQSIILPGEDELSITRAADLLRAGGLVGMPTETVYGLAANALDTTAVAKVFEAKARPSFDPLIVHVGSIQMAGSIGVLDGLAKKLASRFWPGPLTLVVPRQHDPQGNPIVPDLVTAGLDHVGLRLPRHGVARSLLNRSQLPIAAPSANRFGSISPTTAQHVIEELGGKVGVVLDGGPSTCGLESTVARVINDGIEVLRLGALPVEQLEEAAGRAVKIKPPSSAPGRDAKPSPGMTERHYAPRTPMRLIDSLDELPLIRGERVGLIGVGGLDHADGFATKSSLSLSSDLNEAAANLFRALRVLDQSGLDSIVAIKVPDAGIGRAINDRLKRGSTR